MKPRKPLPRSTVPIRRSRVKPSNAKRKAREFARCYHSNERVEWVQSLPCSWCSTTGFSANAHCRTGGAGRKGPYTEILPLCEGIGSSWCHSRYDRHELGLDQDVALQFAKLVQIKWQRHRTAQGTA